MFYDFVSSATVLRCLSSRELDLLRALSYGARSQLALDLALSLFLRDNARRQPGVQQNAILGVAALASIPILPRIDDELLESLFAVLSADRAGILDRDRASLAQVRGAAEMLIGEWSDQGVYRRVRSVLLEAADLGVFVVRNDGAILDRVPLLDAASKNGSALMASIWPPAFGLRGPASIAQWVVRSICRASHMAASICRLLSSLSGLLGCLCLLRLIAGSGASGAGSLLLRGI